MSSLLEGAERKASWGSVLPPGLPYSSSSNAYESGRWVFAGQGRLYGISGYSSDSGAGFALLFDTDAIPGSGAVAVTVIATAATSNFSAYWGSSGRWFRRGCYLAYSSTSPTLTLGSADLFFDAQYIPAFPDAAGAITA